MKTLYLNSQKNERQVSWTKKDYLLKSSQRLGFDYVQDMQTHEGPHQNILNIQPCTIYKGTGWTGLWHIDVSLASDFPDFYKDVDTVFVASSVGIRPDEKQIVMFQACEPTFFNPFSEKTNDVVFCGSRGPMEIYEERDRIYRLLESKYDCVTVPGGKTPEEYISAISHARVQLVQPGMAKAEWGMCAQRFFECLAIGPVLCDYTPDLELLGLVEGRDYFSYKSDRELVKKMNLLLKDDGLRKKMAENGRQMALHLHTYDHRLISILNYLNEHQSFQDSIRSS